MRWIPLLLVVACLKSTVAQAPRPIPMDVIATLNLEHAEPAPSAVAERLAAEIARRGLVPTAVDGDPSDPGPDGAPDEGTDANSGRASLRVESTARFSSQINGRYRWTVSVTATVAPVEGLPTARSFTVPVHLVYYHDKETEALVEAAPLIARQVGELLDDWISAL